MFIYVISVEIERPDIVNHCRKNLYMFLNLNNTGILHTSINKNKLNILESLEIYKHMKKFGLPSTK